MPTYYPIDETAARRAKEMSSHSPPGGIAEGLGRPRDTLTDFLEEIRQKAGYRQWLFGHCHGDRAIDERHLLLWERIVRVI